MGGSPVERGLVAVVLAAVLALALSRVFFPYDLWQYEGGIWAPAELLAHGENPWSIERTVTPPYVMAPYGPLYCAIVGVGLAVFGPQFWWGRAVAVGAMLLASACLCVITRRLTGRRDLGPLAAVAFLAQPAAQHWLATQRPDALALLLSLGALTLATSKRPRVVAIVLCLAGAVLVRQTSVLPLAAVVAHLAATGRRRDALTVGVLAPALLAAVMLAFELTSGGGYLWQQFTLPASVPRTTDQLGTILAILGRAPATWIVLALGAFAVAAPTSATTTPLRAILLAYLALATALAVLTSERLGSNVNYWLEPSALARISHHVTK